MKTLEFYTNLTKTNPEFFERYMYKDGKPDYFTGVIWAINLPFSKLEELKQCEEFQNLKRLIPIHDNSFIARGEHLHTEFYKLKNNLTFENTFFLYCLVGDAFGNLSIRGYQLVETLEPEMNNTLVTN